MESKWTNFGIPHQGGRNPIKNIVNAAIKKHAERVADKMRDLISGPSPSTPFNPPGLDTGTLRDSIKVVHDPDKSRIITDAYYAPYLEEGTSKMQPRPFLQRSLEGTDKPSIKDYMNALWRKKGK